MTSNDLRQRIAVAATFTAEPLTEGLSYWLKRLAIPASVEFAGYSQVFQELLNPDSLLGGNRAGLNVLLVQFKDWLRYSQSGEAAETSEPQPLPWQSLIERNVNDLIAAMQVAASRSATPHLLLLCPSGNADAQQEAFFGRMEERIESALHDASGLYVVKSAEVARLYGVNDYYNAYLDQEGHIPYVPEFYASLATMITRRFFAIRSKPKKVIALDCDHTLWKGVCGEDAVSELELDAGRRYLQELMVAQRDAGMLLCLCSKNNEEDVLEVFDRRKDLPLQMAHLTTWRLNWERKSENLRRIAEELNLGLDSFIFIDDSPLECAEVEASCPEVLTLRLPEDSQEMRGFLDHVWQLDHLKVTREDKQRAELYRQHKQREEVRRASLTFEEFMSGLGLEVTIRELREEEVSRVSELTLRTNQFNLSARRRTEAEVESLRRSERYGCLVVDVKDRFGEYGLVGVIIYEAAGEALEVETMLLSCRALGRGVEHEMVARLGEIARQKALKRVNLEFLPAKKNKPAQDFLEEICSGHKQPQGDGLLYSLPVELAIELNHEPKNLTAEQAGARPMSAQREAGLTGAVFVESPSAQWNEVARKLNTARLIFQAIEAEKKEGPGIIQRPSDKPLVAPRTELERYLAAKWRETFGGVEIGIHDNFFELGADSLKAAGFLNKLQQELNEYIFIVALFDAPTIAELAEYLTARYPVAVNRICGPQSPPDAKSNGHARRIPSPSPRMDIEKIEELRRVVPSLPHYDTGDSAKNPQAVFVLAPPRSGTTLLRVMLGGHPELFAPPELQLLLFNTLQDRRKEFSGRNSFWLEGTMRALMEINGCDGNEAKALMEQYEDGGLSAKEFYAVMQRGIGERRLVDKSPSYAMDIEVLRRAEQ